MNAKHLDCIKGMMFYYEHSGKGFFLEITFMNRMPREDVTDFHQLLLYENCLYPRKIKENAFTFRFGTLPQAKNIPPDFDITSDAFKQLPIAEKEVLWDELFKEYLIKREDIKWVDWNVDKAYQAITQHYPDAQMSISFDSLYGYEW